MLYACIYIYIHKYMYMCTIVFVTLDANVLYIGRKEQKGIFLKKEIQ